MTTRQETENKPQPDKKVTRRPLPPPGRCGSFEEAQKVAMKQYDKTLRELAK